jgi:hypothetical protein
MPTWIGLASGPFGALMLLIIIGRSGFKFFTKLLDKQEARFEKQSMKLNEIHLMTLDKFAEQAVAMTELTVVVKDFFRTYINQPKP